MDFHETEHLSVDHDGTVRFGHIEIGELHDDPRWPSWLGLEASWFDDEIEELRDVWNDAQGNDTRTAAADAFRSALGGLRG